MKMPETGRNKGTYRVGAHLNREEGQAETVSILIT
jgi:hypothetical protein